MNEIANVIRAAAIGIVAMLGMESAMLVFLLSGIVRHLKRIADALEESDDDTPTLTTTKEK